MLCYACYGKYDDVSIRCGSRKNLTDTPEIGESPEKYCVKINKQEEYKTESYYNEIEKGTTEDNKNQVFCVISSEV